MSCILLIQNIKKINFYTPLPLKTPLGLGILEPTKKSHSANQWI